MSASIPTKATRRGLPMRAFEQAAEILRVLSHPVRLKLIELLSGHDLTVNQLAARLALPQNQVSGHLNQMRTHGILKRQRAGRNVHYHIAHPHALSVLRIIQKYEQVHRTYQGGEAI